jgi:hypothetical protein
MTDAESVGSEESGLARVTLLAALRPVPSILPLVVAAR